MADPNANQLVEGYDPRDRKPVDKEQDGRKMQEMRRELMLDEERINKELRAEQAKLKELQEKLSGTNEKYEKEKREVQLKKDEHSKTLDVDEQLRIQMVSERVLSIFMQKSPMQGDEPVAVDINFLKDNQAEDNSGGGALRIGGEGAGSRDAKFMVQLSQKVETLASQAAKYWGLDPQMVFFLDRDGRIVPDDMCLSEIVLPPVAGQKSSASTAGSGDFAGAASGPTSLPALTARPGASMAIERAELWTVRGRNYSLTLVQAGTVLDSQDLDHPQGENTVDFTLDLNALDAELEEQRKKRGDMEEQPTAITMNDIPSLHKLIQDGINKKRRKWIDFMCRMTEFLVFVTCFGLFHVLVYPPTSTRSMQLVSQFVDERLTRFTNEEQDSFGFKSFYEVSGNEAIHGWIYGPLLRTLTDKGNSSLGHHNVFIIGSTGYVFKPSDENSDPACDAYSISASGNGTNDSNDSASVSNSSNDSNVTTASLTERRCSGELGMCKNDRVFAILDDAQTHGDWGIPRCAPLFDMGEAEGLFKTWGERGNEYTFIKGSVSTYAGGESFHIPRDSAASFRTSMDAQWPRIQSYPSAMISVFAYSPSLNGVLVYLMLVEHTQSGSIMTKKKLHIVDLENKDPWYYLCYVVTIISALATLCMEVRRVIGWPRFGLGDEKDPCSILIIAFVLLPVLVFTGFVLFVIRGHYTADEVLHLDATQTISHESLEELYRLSSFDYWKLGLDVTTLILFNLIFLRYLLLFFPQMVFVSEMAKKLLRPLSFLILFILTAFCLFGMLFYVLYSTQFFEFRNLTTSFLETVRFVQGRAPHWLSLWEDNQVMWTFLMSFAYMSIALVLNNLAAAVMLSHKKEKDLHENYSYHPFWASERSKQKRGKDPGEFNPATAGEPFEDVEEKDDNH